ncbi:aspartate-alanine antiporter [Brevibacterium aurantiacum]|uniref:Aspartate-alanine antiporter n=1 Tax=Brevibacterium aurantiacum TaxID=273384 RepID=A0A3Q9NPE6_BREAU|nr:aspartate-alanine antiporter [Brevibacterium aurantiacum]AZT92082.1 aspartate-alanine antiporter [Brevibacterium aurantiacum]
MSVIRDHPEIALFLCISLGYLLGKLRVGPVTLGGICGTLIVALVIGSQHVSIDDGVRTVFFALFIFSLGYMAGPQFFSSLNKGTLRFLVLCLIEITCVVGIAYALARLLGLDVGTASGILAGAATESAVVGTATEAIGNIPGLSPDTITGYQANVATAYTVCYLFGLITVVLYTSQIMPLLLRFNLRDASRALAEKMRKHSGAQFADDEVSALPLIVGRTYRVTTGDGSTVDELNECPDGEVTVEAVTRGNRTMMIEPGLKLESDDLVLVVGRRVSVVEIGRRLGVEVAGMPGAETPMTTQQVVITQREANGKTLHELQKDHPELRNTGVYVTDLVRSTDQRLLVSPETRLHRGDILTLVGARAAVDRLIKKIGATVSRNSTDFVYIGLGIVVGALLGQIEISAGPVVLSLGTGGGCLVSGLVFGWLRSRVQTFGAYPAQASTTLKDLGLAVFIACTGLAAGPQALPMLKQYGLLLPVAGILMVLVPATLSLLIGHFVLKIDKPVLLGAIAGQQCSTPAITAITQSAQSSIPMPCVSG